MVKKTPILVVDDDKEFLEEAREVLNVNGYKTIIATTGKAAKKQVKEHHPKVVLVDRKLPDADGQELIKDLKKIDKKTHFIIVTAYGDMESAIKGFRSGVVDYINKPVDLAELLQKIDIRIKEEKAEEREAEQIRQWAQIETKKYTSLFQKANDAIFLIGAESGVIVDCNEIAVKLLGYKREKIIGEHQVFLYPPEEKDKYENLFKKCIASEGLVEEVEIWTKNRRKIQVVMSASVIEIDDKKYVQAILRDLSELRQKERALKKSENKYRDLLNIVPGIVYITQMPQGHAVYINERIKYALGFTQAEWLTNKYLWNRQIHPEDRKRVGEERRKAIKDRTFFEATYRMFHKNGKDVKWFKDRALITEIKGEEEILTTGVMVDITDVKIQQEENERLSSAIRDINESVIITDRHNVIVYCNCAADRMFGYESQECYGVREFLGKHTNMIFSELNPPLLSAEIEREILQGRSWRGEIIAKRKNETTFPCFLRVDPLKDELGHVKGSIAIVTDITEKRLLEDELRRRAQVLEEAVENRTKDLQKAMEKLEDANQKLKQYDKLKSEFVANVAHEIINPLTVMKESVLNITDHISEHLDSQEKRIFEILKREIERLARFTSNMLDLSRIELGRMPLSRTKIEINPLLREIEEFFRDEAKSKKINFVIQSSDAPPHIWGDKGAIKEIFINIIRNAFKYTPAGKNVEVKVFKEDDFMQIEIKDHGSGIAPEELEKIFDKFHRVFAEKEKGTGLGLPITKEIVELHKGKIWVESELGRGSKVTVLLPVDVRKLG